MILHALFQKETDMASKPSSLPVYLVCEADWDAGSLALDTIGMAYARAIGFKPSEGRILALPAGDCGVQSVLFGVGGDAGLAANPLLLGKLATDLPAGRYHLVGALADPTLALTGFYLGRYRFDRFKKLPGLPEVELIPPSGADAGKARIVADAVAWGRTLINRPTSDLTTSDLAQEALALAAEFGAKTEEISGDALLARGFPLVHAVGRAGSTPPRLVDIRWGNPKHKKVTLVGKGVVFDTGGLNIKPDASMLLMRKDMGGAAVALTAARIVMALNLPVQLRVLLPIVENSIASNAFRPGDIYRARNGISVEIGNTDAEGRLILADALSYADDQAPDLLLDFSTLTGAARVALGPDLPAFFTGDDKLATAVESVGMREKDPVCRLPLWKPYLSMLDSKYADINNVGSGGFAGAITAALFLSKFVTKTKSWGHFDLYGWNPSSRPGRPEGGEPQVARLVAALLALKLD